MSEDAPIEGEILEPSTTAVAEREAGGDAITAPPLPQGVMPSPNYMKAVELGHVLAKSNYFPDARDAAKAAVKVMVGMDMGISPTAALLGIHTMEKEGKISFLIEGKLLASVIRQRAGYDFQIVERTAETCTLRFLRDGEPVNSGDGLAGPDVTFSMEDASRADLSGPTRSGKPGMYDKYPEEMLFWRCMAKGVRIHFPELLSGQPVYVDVEMGENVDDLRGALNPGVQPVQTERAEAARVRARELKDELDKVNPQAMTGARFGQAMRNADHSEVQLENLVEVLAENLANEKRVLELTAEVDEKLPESAAKALKDRVSRIKGPAGKVEKLEEALAQISEETTNESEATDGSSDDTGD